MTRDAATVVFGLEDGASSAVGVILGAGLSLSSRSLIVASVALAVSASVSMAGGQWLAAGNARQAAVMGGATFIGSFGPAIPWLVSGGALAFALCGLVALGLGVCIAELRPGAPLPSYAQTFGVLIASSGLAVGASLIAGAAA